MSDTESLREKLEAVRCQLDSWRKTRISRQNVPEPFWKAAVELARIGGINPVAAVLGLNYYRLKRRVEANQSAVTESKAVSFVELQVTTGDAMAQRMRELHRSIQRLRPPPPKTGTICRVSAPADPAL